MTQRGTKVTALLLAGSLVLAGGGRVLSNFARDAAKPEILRTATGDAASDQLGKLDSFALTLLLGGFRGPLVMALWSSSNTQRAAGDLGSLETKIELIRLLQPQFDTVHVYQIHNKAYNLSVERANLPSKYAVILSAVDYANSVLEERPNNINIESQLGKVFSNKLGGSVEKDYFTQRVYDETQATGQLARLTFPSVLDGEFRLAAIQAGVRPQSVVVRGGENGRQSSVLPMDIAEQVAAVVDSPQLELVALPPQDLSAGIGLTSRLEPILDEAGNLLPKLTQPTRDAPEGATAGEYLDGSRFQFLPEFGPFPEGVSPHALAYEHFSKARVLQQFAGQRHAEDSESFINVSPARALREWSIETFELGRMREAEAFGNSPPPRTRDGELQAEVEVMTADVSLTAEPDSRPLLEQAVRFYERSRQVGAAARQALEDHIEAFPSTYNNLISSVERLNDLDVLLQADLIYANALLTESDAERLRESASLYREADREMVRYILKYHDVAAALPDGMTKQQVLAADELIQRQMFENLRALRARGPLVYEHTRAFDEFDGYRRRIAARLAEIDRYLD
ncbi:MAG: hypothetical protein AAGK78_04565 [Planctomycetota bacterium]